MRILKEPYLSAWLRIMAQCYMPSRKSLVAILALAGASAIISAVAPLLAKAIFDDALPARDTRLLLLLGTAWAASMATASILSFVHSYILTKADSEATSRLRTRVFQACLQELRLCGEGRRPHGERLSRIMTDPEALVGEAGMRPLLAFLTRSFMLLILCGIAFYLDWLLALISVTSGLVAVLLQMRSPQIVKRASHALSSSRAHATATIENLLASWRVIVRYGKIGDETLTAEGEFRRLAASQLNTQKQKYLASLRVSLLLQLAPIVLALVAVHRMMAGNTTVGTLVAFFSYASMISSALSGLITSLLKLWSGYGQTMECVKLISDHDTTENVLDVAMATHSLDEEAVRTIALSHIVITAGGHSVRASDLFFEHGRTYLFTGDSGTGKSLFLEFLAGLRSCATGRIIVDGTDHEPAEYMRHAKSYALVQKDEVLFDRDVTANITYGLHTRADNWLDWLTALRMDFARRESAKGLSAGEKQRVSFIRELLRKPPVFIIDEGLDSLEESLGQEALVLLRRVLPDAILIICTHNWRRQVPVDDVLLIADGHIMQQSRQIMGIRG